MKSWSITTTMRNTERISDFLLVLQNIEGKIWNLPIQKKYQVLLIQHKKYGAGDPPYNLSGKSLNLENN
jgi:hypothetical protein